MIENTQPIVTVQPTNPEATQLCTHCGEAPIEWVDLWCQVCWENHCEDTYQEMLSRIENHD